MNKLNVAITGVAGFVGSHLVDRCMRLGWNIVGIDNLSTGLEKLADPMRVEGIGHGKYRFCRMDVNNTSMLIDRFKGCDVVFHLAAIPKVPYSVEHPIETEENNSRGTLSVLEAAKIAKVKRVIFSCSSSIYGGIAPIPTKETDVTYPKSPYALQKQTGAEYCRLYSELYGLDTVSLIYFNVFGSRQYITSAYASVIPSFFHAAKNNKPCIIHGDGTQSRDFCYIDNVVEANILAAMYEERFNGERFNIACGETHTINDVFEKVQQLLNIKCEKFNEPPRAGDVKVSQADITKATNILKYKPIVKFDAGMKLTSQWWNLSCPLF